MKFHEFANSSLLNWASWHEWVDLPPCTVGPNGYAEEEYPLLVISMKVGDRKSVYHYFRVPKSRFEELISAPSPGSFYNQNIKGVFSSKKIS